MAEPPLDSARLFVAGIDHRSSPVELRERVFIAEAELPGFLAALREAGIAQAVLLSTCDRTEVQGAHRDPAQAGEAVLRLLAARGREPEFRRYSYALTDAAALRRIFGVAAALESHIVGEPQVLGQLKAAHQQALATRMMGPELEAALQAAYAAAKRARTETAIGQRPVTLVSAALQLARDVHGDLGRCAGLLLGAGDMGELMADHLKAAGLKSLTVSGPSSARAEDAARRLRCHVVPFGDLETPLAGADILITAIGGGRHAVSAAAMERALVHRRRRPVFVIDLGVPVDVDPTVEALDGVFRYDLDDLEQVAMSGLASRSAAAAEAWAIVEQELALFAKSRAERAAAPIITALRRHFEITRSQVLREAGGDAARATELLMNRLLHGPSEALRKIASGEAGPEIDRDTAERLIAKLFRFDEDGPPQDEERRN